MLHEPISGEWSSIQTLRHLAFATESWAGRGILGDLSLGRPLSPPWDEMGPDRVAARTWGAPFARRGPRLAALSDSDAAAGGRRPDQPPARRPVRPARRPRRPGEGETFPVRRCPLVVRNEEWRRRLDAGRDLAVLEKSN